MSRGFHVACSLVYFGKLKIVSDTNIPTCGFVAVFQYIYIYSVAEVRVECENVRLNEVVQQSPRQLLDFSFHPLERAESAVSCQKAVFVGPTIRGGTEPAGNAHPRRSSVVSRYLYLYSTGKIARSNRRNWLHCKAWLHCGAGNIEEEQRSSARLPFCLKYLKILKTRTRDEEVDYN